MRRVRWTRGAFVGVAIRAATVVWLLVVASPTTHWAIVVVVALAFLGSEVQALVAVDTMRRVERMEQRQMQLEHSFAQHHHTLVQLREMRRRIDGALQALDALWQPHERARPH